MEETHHQVTPFCLVFVFWTQTASHQKIHNAVTQGKRGNPGRRQRSDTGKKVPIASVFRGYVPGSPDPHLPRVQLPRVPSSQDPISPGPRSQSLAHDPGTTRRCWEGAMTRPGKTAPSWAGHGPPVLASGSREGRPPTGGSAGASSRAAQPGVQTLMGPSTP